MKYIVTFIICLFIGAGCYVVYHSYAYTQRTIQGLPEQLITPTLSPFSIAPPPRSSLEATIKSLDGEVFWLSRIATTEAQLQQATQLKQGEEIITKDDGEASIVFPNLAEINIQPQTTILFAQTLPANIVLVQTEGIATYKRVGDIPLTIRSSSLLIDLQKNAEVDIERTDDFVEITVLKGKIELAYNDAQLTSKRVLSKQGDSLRFDIEDKVLQ